METIDADVPCMRCGYNLRTLPRDGACPECGTSITETLRHHVIRDSELGRLRLLGDPWLQAMRRGLDGTIAAWFAGASIIVLLTGGISMYTAVGGSLYLLPFVASFVVSCRAAWHIAEPRYARGVAPWIRTLLVVDVAALGLLFLNVKWARYYGHYLPALQDVPDDAWRYPQTLGELAMIAWPIATAYTTARMTRLAWIGRRRDAAAILALVGTLTTGVHASLAFGFNAYRTSVPSSSEFAAYLLGPSGVVPALWLALFAIVADFRFGFGDAIGNLAALAIVGVIVAAITAALFRLRGALTRAIQLGGLPEASSRSSPSPRPPA